MENKDWLTLIVLAGVISILATVFVFFGFNTGLQRVTGHATGVTNVTVYTTVSLTTVRDNVYLGNLTIGDSNQTSNTTMGDGFQIRNDGNVLLNVSMSATNLFATAANPSTYYRYLVSDAGEGATNTSVFIETGTTLAWTNVPTASTKIISLFNSSDTNDIAEIDVNITIPTAETAGLKTSTVTFTAVDAIS